MLTTGPLNDLTGVRHGFFTRQGGVSEGIYDSLNCGFGSGDRAEVVAANRARAMARIEIEPARLVTVWQHHSPDVVTVEAPWAQGDNPKADALVTRRPGIALGILTADCAPVLLAEAAAGVVGAVHAGWKGALGGVLERTVAAMVALGASAERIVAGVGPCIAQRSYEVGPEFAAPFLAQDPENESFFQDNGKTGKAHFDLKGYVARRLVAAGVTRVEVLPCDTCAEERLFFSNRRAVKRGEGDYGRGLSAIYLEP
ncbi:MAG: peptidoglycan editing factor PgeF [Tistlia sp.]|uniref:peptidoglycan editing factor PgeF n=1 Tax=Tistlia sp. TaxID=3057121 RepID=UPI0034A2BAAF